MDFIPTGTALGGGFTYFVDGVPTTPAIPPTVTAAYYPDGTLLDPLPEIGDPTSDGHYEVEFFAAGENTLEGVYTAFAHTDDDAIDNQTIGPLLWGVDNRLAEIQARTDLIGIGVLFSSMPVGPDGRTQLVKGSTYKTTYGLALEYEFDGYPAFPLVGGSCTWFALARHSSVPFSKVGTILTTTRVRFELTYTEAASLAGNVCSIQVMLAADNPIRTPNMPLDLLDSVGA